MKNSDAVAELSLVIRWEILSELGSTEARGIVSLPAIQGGGHFHVNYHGP